jgi:hypothetical protein
MTQSVEGKLQPAGNERQRCNQGDEISMKDHGSLDAPR